MHPRIKFVVQEDGLHRMFKVAALAVELTLGDSGLIRFFSS